MKKYFTLFTALSLCTVLHAQIAPSIEWEKSYGGTNEDEASSIHETTNGGFIIAGESYSNDIDVSGNHGASDYWIVKMDASGTIDWQKTLGGTINDVASDVQQASDGGYIVCGFSRSNNGDVTGHHGSTSTNDYWVVRLDSIGNLLWQKSLGGSFNDFANSIVQTEDGGFVVAGYSSSNDGDVTGHHGSTVSSDYWIVKLDSTGNLLWQKSLGGNSPDNANQIQRTSDGGLIVCGSSSSNDGDVSGNHGNSDFWLVKLNASGNLLWQKCFGGIGDDVASSLAQTSNNGFIIAGWSNSNDGDVSGNHGNYDYWVVKSDDAGNLVWQKSLGGTAGEFAYSVTQTSDNGFVVGGYSGSGNGDVTGYHGGVFWGDYWIAKLDALGYLDWQKCLGGTNDEVANSVLQTTGGGIIVAGWSESSDDDVTVNYGSADVWVVQLSVATSAEEHGEATAYFSLSPNPANKVCHLILHTIASESTEAIVSFTNLLGGQVFLQSYPALNGNLEEEISLDKNFADGIYLVKVTCGDHQWIQQLVISR